MVQLSPQAGELLSLTQAVPVQSGGEVCPGLSKQTDGGKCGRLLARSKHNPRCGARAPAIGSRAAGLCSSVSFCAVAGVRADFSRTAFEGTCIPDGDDAVRDLPFLRGEYADIQMPGVPQGSGTGVGWEARVSRAAADEQSQRQGLRALSPGA